MTLGEQPINVRASRAGARPDVAGGRALHAGSVTRRNRGHRGIPMPAVTRLWVTNVGTQAPRDRRPPAELDSRELDCGDMPRTTTNKSLRADNPIKAQRRVSIDDGETNERRDVAGADGTPRRGPRRPGRAASLRTTSQRTRSQKWRSTARGKTQRAANPSGTAQSAARRRPAK
jgi:hypothetical protein